MIAFWVVGIGVGLLAATIVAAYTQVILALIVGALIGAAAGGVTAAAVWVWPVARVLVHWFPEITLAVGIPWLLTQLAELMWAPFAIASLAAVVGVLFAVSVTRRFLLGWSWCVITRHRLRACFSGFLAGNRDGSLPLILWAKPTPVGERVWIWLRPGLSLSMLQDRLEQIAVTCWGKDVSVVSASPKYAAYLRFDIKRRNTLAATVASPLVGETPQVPSRPVPTQAAAADLEALDLPDVPAEAVNTEATPARSKAAASNVKTDNGRQPAAAGADGDDVSDWI